MWSYLLNLSLKLPFLPFFFKLPLARSRWRASSKWAIVKYKYSKHVLDAYIIHEQKDIINISFSHIHIYIYIYMQYTYIYIYMQYIYMRYIYICLLCHLALWRWLHHRTKSMGRRQGACPNNRYTGHTLLGTTAQHICATGACLPPALTSGLELHATGSMSDYL